jgi:hypothetical protein
MGGGAANGSMASAPRVLAEATCSHTGRPKGTAPTIQAKLLWVTAVTGIVGALTGLMSVLYR